jgi:hypothetical protein
LGATVAIDHAAFPQHGEPTLCRAATSKHRGCRSYWGSEDGKRRRDSSAMVATYHSLAQIIIGLLITAR